MSIFEMAATAQHAVDPLQKRVALSSLQSAVEMEEEVRGQTHALLHGKYILGQFEEYWPEAPAPAPAAE